MAKGKTQEVYSDGLHYGLPVIDEAHSGLRAIVVGASGMSGQPMIDVLAQDPHRWEKVYALSRRPPAISESQAKIVEHVPTDLLKDPQETGAALQERGVKA